MAKTTKTSPATDPIAARNRRALKRATADPRAALDAMLTMDAKRAIFDAADTFATKGKQAKADRLHGLVWECQQAAQCLSLHEFSGGMPAAAAARIRLHVIKQADADAAGSGLTALTIGIEAAGWTGPIPAEPYRPVNRASLPRLHRVSALDAHALAPVPDTLPAFMDGDIADRPQMALPGLETGPGCPSWILSLFDRSGGGPVSDGRGAPWSLRLFVGALLHLAVADRDGEWHTLRFPVAEVERWLHPNGWTNRRRDWAKLPKALQDMQRRFGYVPVRGFGSVMVAAPTVIPISVSDPIVEFTVRLPPAAASGARLDWNRLRRYGAESAPRYRAYLAVAALLDQTAHRGAPVTRLIGAAKTTASGKPVMRRGRPVRDDSVMVPHPFASYAPTFTDRDAARFVGFDPDDRRRRCAAIGALELLADDDVIDLVRGPRGTFRLFGPRRQAKAVAE